ncbi:MAG TPA: glycosyltransferase [Verrucomicrobiae bacterium]|jgi:glycosyltransferase involved in cell wall biosynthesis|nr:glycosyltransferase [Verrucomicrobiae bacterium]
MKILYAHLYDARYSMGGAEKVLYDLAVTMKERRGHEVSCAVNPGQLAKALRHRGIEVREIALEKYKTLKTLEELRRMIREISPDVIHSHHRFTTFLLDVFFKRKIPVIHTEHVLRNDKKFLFRAGTMATAVHETVGKNLIQEFRVPSDKVRVIPNAVLPCYPRRDILPELRRAYPRREGEVFAAFTGRLEEQKGHRYLIAAVARLAAGEKKRLRIFLLGDGSLEPALKQQAKDAGVTDNFVFLGHTDRVAEFLALADFFVLPSLWEGMPLSVLEAFSAAKPVLATDIPGTRELMDAATGRLVPARDPKTLAAALSEWINAPGLLKPLGETAFKKWQKEYAFDVMVSRYEDLYKEMAAKGKS